MNYKKLQKKIFGQKLPLHNLVASTLNHLGEQGLLASQHLSVQPMTLAEVKQRLEDIGHSLQEGENGFKNYTHSKQL